MVRGHAYVFGAAGPADGRRDSLVLPWADTEAMSLFLGEVAGRHRGEYVLMFMDRAASGVRSAAPDAGTGRGG
jgi:hypothetical protein